MISAWPLLRGTEEEQNAGLKIVRARYAQKMSPSHIMELGVAYLWLKQYQSAYDHFEAAIQRDSKCGDNDYGMAGVAKWCLGKPDEAVQEWHAGVKAKYARSGLSITMPLLLFYAAIRRPEVFDRSLAEKLIREKLGNSRINNWPGPIARLLLDQIGEVGFQNYCRGIKPGDDTSKNPFIGHSQHQTSSCLWQAEFYKSVLALSRKGSLSDFKSAMQKLSDSSQPEWQDDRNVFTARIWHEEFFLARYESEVNLTSLL